MYIVVGEHVFPFLRGLGGDDSTYVHHMKDARFTIPTPALLAKVVDLIDNVPMEDRDTKGDLYEYMLGKIASAGQNGQFRTPRHIIQLMVELTAPQPKDIICDPACGTGGFLVAAGEYLREHQPGILHDTKLKQHFHLFENGFVYPRTGGMSATPDSIWNIPSHRRPRGMSMGSSGKITDRIYALANVAIPADKLKVRRDPKKPEMHAFVEPAVMIELAGYEKDLADTRNNWRQVWP
jgi:hypothetical protein